MTQPTTTEPDLTEAMEVWREAIDAASDSSIKFKTRADQAAARVIFTALEARDATIGYRDCQIAALKQLVSERDARIAKLEGALGHPPKHRYWGAGEPDCPREIKCGNGELHTLRCKVCGEDSPRNQICLAALGETADAS